MVFKDAPFEVLGERDAAKATVAADRHGEPVENAQTVAPDLGCDS
ncbi:hypothetical protein [Streptomyces sp. 13-12-16]|nr:hypothetical protein [Streptomyces sp. 13-12-16]